MWETRRYHDDTITVECNENAPVLVFGGADPDQCENAAHMVTDYLNGVGPRLHSNTLRSADNSVVVTFSSCFAFVTSESMTAAGVSKWANLYFGPNKIDVLLKQLDRTLSRMTRLMDALVRQSGNATPEQVARVKTLISKVEKWHETLD